MIAALYCATTSFAALIESSDIENDGTWTIGTTDLQFIGPCCGIAPTVGAVGFHFNSGSTPAHTGTNSIVFASTLQAGDYNVTIDVGNFNNAPFSDIGHLGMTAGGNLLTTTTSNTPTPGSGVIEEWSFDYTIAASNSSIGQSIGFEIFVPFTGTGSKNVLFDNLQVNFEASTVPEPQTYLLFLFCILGLLSQKRIAD